MKKLLLLFLLSGCLGNNDSLSTGAGVYANFCGGTDYAIMEEKGVSLGGLIDSPELVIALKNELTGSMILLNSGDRTSNYLPGELDEDDYYVLMDRKALEGSEDYCDYTVSINKRTNSYLIINTTKLLLFS